MSLVSDVAVTGRGRKERLGAWTTLPWWEGPGSHADRRIRLLMEKFLEPRWRPRPRGARGSQKKRVPGEEGPRSGGPGGRGAIWWPRPSRKEAAGRAWEPRDVGRMVRGAGGDGCQRGSCPRSPPLSPYLSPRPFLTPGPGASRKRASNPSSIHGRQRCPFYPGGNPDPRGGEWWREAPHLPRPWGHLRNKNGGAGGGGDD